MTSYNPQNCQGHEVQGKQNITRLKETRRLPCVILGCFFCFKGMESLGKRGIVFLPFSVSLKFFTIFLKDKNMLIKCLLTSDHSH